MALRLRPPLHVATVATVASAVNAVDGASAASAASARPDLDAGSIVLFLPAFEEQDAIGAVIDRVPSTVCGRAVVCLVIDDGSRDATAARARAAGAEVVGLGANRGLGAAVRAGLRESLARGAAVVAFCDADGEYAPEELERLVTPILSGTADYVVGTRFGDGRPFHMRAHRCLGNRLLTRWLSFTARRPITDGQTGFRALSARAAAAAEIAHDYNYAQVLTLDLLARGFRYAEVPISYRFRTTGRSFVRLVPYLRAVVPAVYRVVNRPSPVGRAPVRSAQSSTTWPANERRASLQRARSMRPV